MRHCDTGKRVRTASTAWSIAADPHVCSSVADGIKRTWFERSSVIKIHRMKSSATLREITNAQFLPTSHSDLKAMRDQSDSSLRWLTHNHPSGDPTPSRADVQMTRQIVES
jgi:proteasome lid subunit RPN8/RPN11